MPDEGEPFFKNNINKTFLRTGKEARYE